MKPERPMRLGIIGFGRLARAYYLPALASLGVPLRISAADPSAESAAAVRRHRSVRSLYGTWEELLDRESPDALLVAAPPSTHLQVWYDASARNVPVFMEKPFPLTSELDRIDSSDPRNALLMIDFNRRLWPAYRWIAERLRDGAIGRPLSGRFVLRVNLGPWSNVSDHRRKPGEGGVLHDLGSQMLDLSMMVMGEQPASLISRRSGERSDPDSVHLELLFPSGARVTCETAYSARTAEHVSITGTNGRLWIDDPNFRPWLVTQGKPRNVMLQRSMDYTLLGYRAVFRSRSMLRFTVREALSQFITRIRCGAGSFSPGFEDALRVARLLRAAEQSADHAMPITLQAP